MDVITTAGLDSVGSTPNPRRELIKGIRQVLRRQDASEDEDVDALEALIEMSKE